MFKIAVVFWPTLILTLCSNSRWYFAPPQRGVLTHLTIRVLLQFRLFGQFGHFVPFYLVLIRLMQLVNKILLQPRLKLVDSTFTDLMTPMQGSKCSIFQGRTYNPFFDVLGIFSPAVCQLRGYHSVFSAAIRLRMKAQSLVLSVVFGFWLKCTRLVTTDQMQNLWHWFSFLLYCVDTSVWSQSENKL